MNDFIDYNGKYIRTINRKPTPAYSKWNSIKNRLQNYEKEGNWSYKNCTMSEEWRNFQNFADWFYKNHTPGWELDKDLLSKGSKIYSEETCCFIPQRVNSFLSGVAAVLDETKSCWNFREKYGVYVANVSDGRKRLHLGHFTNERDATVAYVKGKLGVLTSIEREYAGKFTERVSDGLTELKNKIIKKFDCSREDLKNVGNSKLKRKERYVTIDGEYISVVNLANKLNMRYRTLYACLYTKKMSIQVVIEKYDKELVYKNSTEMEIDYYE